MAGTSVVGTEVSCHWWGVGAHMPPWHPGVMSGIGLTDAPDLVSFPPLNSMTFQNVDGVSFTSIHQCLAQHLAPEEYSINGRWTKRRKGDRKKKRGRKEKKE